MDLWKFNYHSCSVLLHAYYPLVDATSNFSSFKIHQIDLLIGASLQLLAKVTMVWQLVFKDLEDGHFFFIFAFSI